MRFSPKTCRFALVLVATYSTVTSAVDLKSAKNYVILAKSGISTVPTSVITGDIAVSPIAATAITGFSLVADSSNKWSTSSQLGAFSRAFAADYAVPTPGLLTTAVSDMEAAYTAAANLPNNNNTRWNIGAGTLGGVNGGADNPLTPGVYTFKTDVTIAETIYFDGDATDVFTIQIFGKLVQAANTKVICTGGALARNIFWQVSGNAAMGAGCHMEGVLLIFTDIVFVTGSTLNGHAYSQTACNLQKATINCCDYTEEVVQ
jgi:hypothetical protein